MYGGHADTIFWQAVFRWLHVIFGIMWIGLLWYFNFVQTRMMPQIPAELRPAVSKYIAPEALFWFRWAAAFTLLMGIILAWSRGFLIQAYTLGATEGFANKGHILIGVGMWLGTIMAFNVWVFIWPNQKKVLGLVEADDARQGGGRPDRRAGLAHQHLAVDPHAGRDDHAADADRLAERPFRTTSTRRFGGPTPTGGSPAASSPTRRRAPTWSRSTPSTMSWRAWPRVAREPLVAGDSPDLVARGAGRDLPAAARSGATPSPRRLRPRSGGGACRSAPLEGMIEARYEAIDGPPADEAAQLARIDRTAGAVMRLAVAVLAPGAADSPADRTGRRGPGR